METDGMKTGCGAVVLLSLLVLFVIAVVVSNNRDHAASSRNDIPAANVPLTQATVDAQATIDAGPNAVATSIPTPTDILATVTPTPNMRLNAVVSSPTPGVPADVTAYVSGIASDYIAALNALNGLQSQSAELANDPYLVGAVSWRAQTARDLATIKRVGGDFQAQRNVPPDLVAIEPRVHALGVDLVSLVDDYAVGIDDLDAAAMGRAVDRFGEIQHEFDAINQEMNAIAQRYHVPAQDTLSMTQGVSATPVPPPPATSPRSTFPSFVLAGVPSYASFHVTRVVPTPAAPFATTPAAPSIRMLPVPTSSPTRVVPTPHPVLTDIPGLSAAHLVQRLGAHGWKCAPPKTTQGDTTWSCTDDPPGDKVHALLDVSGKSEATIDHIDLFVFQSSDLQKTDPNGKVDGASALAVFADVTTEPYDGASPAQLQAWVQAGIPIVNQGPASVRARTIDIGTAHVELSGASSSLKLGLWPRKPD